jgi:hypothetical protein
MMSYPMKRNLIPLAERHIADTGKKILYNGKVSNNRKGLKRCVWDSVYDYGILLWKSGMVIRKSGHYFLALDWYGMPYPYKRGVDLRSEL